MDENTNDLIPVGYSKFRIEFIFWLGITSAVLLRAAKLIDPFSSSLGKLAWYTAVIGYIFFFIHRLQVSTRRKNVVEQLELLKKVENQEKLNDLDYKALKYILWSIHISKERINYIFIIIFSFVAVLAGLYIDVF